MPLILTLRPQQEFTAGDDEFVIEEVRREDDYTVVRKRDNKRFEITSLMSRQITDGVMLSAGAPEAMAKLVFEAPRDIPVHRSGRR